MSTDDARVRLTEEEWSDLALAAGWEADVEECGRVVERILADRLAARDAEHREALARVRDDVMQVGAHIGHYRTAARALTALLRPDRASVGRVLSDLRGSVNADYHAALPADPQGGAV